MAVSIEQFDKAQTLESLEQLHELASCVFDSMERDYLSWRVSNMPDLVNFVAKQEGHWIGFKCGYGMTKRRYYSWLGGVTPEVRGQGVASLLMQSQHDWLRSTVYEVVETHVRQENPAMVNTNLKYGFKIIGRFLKSDQTNLIMQASL